jgi:hypothetical protein
MSHVNTSTKLDLTGNDYVDAVAVAAAAGSR